MSNIYIQEPPTNGKVLLTTSVGEIEVELWSKEAPKACRNFVQLCMEGYYNGTIFHRVVPEFIVQGGDPTSTGHGGESIYGKPFKDEFHSRLRFVRRGLLAMANAGAHDNSSQFFFTLAAAPELNNKHTVFGKIAGDTIYNMIKLAECETDSNDRPFYPHKVVKTEVISNPFDDIVPREITKDTVAEDESKQNKSQSKATKNFSLLSFGEEAEEDEEEVNIATEQMKHKSKSSHDILDDNRLSSVPALDDTDIVNTQKEEDEDKQKNSEMTTEPSEKSNAAKERIRKKLKKTEPMGTDDKVNEPTTKSMKIEDLQKEAALLKKQIRESMKSEATKTKSETTETDETTDHAKLDPSNPVAMHKADRLDYKKKCKQPKKGVGRESATLEILAKFQAKLNATSMMREYDDDDDDDDEGKGEEEEGEEDENDMSWMGHKLKFDVRQSKVLDANVNDADRYEINDPRNPMTKRRVEASKQAMKKQK